MKMKYGQKAVLYSKWKQYTGINATHSHDMQPNKMCTINMVKGGGVVKIMNYMESTGYYAVKYKTPRGYSHGYLHESTVRAIKNHKKRKGKKKK